MALLFDYSPQAKRVLFLVSSRSPHLSTALARFHSLQQLHSGSTDARPRLLAAFDSTSPSLAGELSENSLLTHLTGFPVYSNSEGALFANANGITEQEAASYLGENYDLFKTHSLNWELLPEKNGIVRESLALYRVGRELAQHAGHSHIVCEGWQAFDAGLRLKRELGSKTIFSFHELAGGDEGIESRQAAALANADGVLASSLSVLKAIADGYGASLGEKAVDLRRGLEAVSLAREKRSLSLLIKNPALELEERRQAISFMKQTDQSLSRLGVAHSPFHLRTTRFALLPHSLREQSPGQSISREEIVGARKKLLATPAVGGSRSLAGKSLVYAAVDSKESAWQLLNSLAHVPQEISLVVDATVSTDGFAGTAISLGLGDRVALVNDASGSMLACQAIALPQPAPSSFSSALRACALAEEVGLKNGPVLLTGESHFHALEENALLLPSLPAEKWAQALHAAVADEALRARLKNSALHAARAEWTPQTHAQELAAFLAGV